MADAPDALLTVVTDLPFARDVPRGGEIVRPVARPLAVARLGRRGRKTGR